MAADNTTNDFGQPNTRLHRHRWWVVAAVVVTLVLGAGVVVFGTDLFGLRDSPSAGSTDTESTAEDSCDIDTAPGDDDVEAVATPEDGEVAVAEDGHSLSEPSEGWGVMGYGTLLHNTTDAVAGDISVTVTATDDSGERVINVYEDEEWETTYDVPFLMPDDTFGFGHGATLEMDETDTDVELQFDIEVGQWWQHDANVIDTVTATLDERQRNFDVVVNLILHSPFCEPVEEGKVAVLYRDTNGDIIGGGHDHDVEGSEFADTEEFPPGEAEGTVSNLWYLSTAKDYDFDEKPAPQETEVYPYFSVQDDG